jgi:hypothetical protein
MLKRIIYGLMLKELEALVCRLKNTEKSQNCQILIATGSFKNLAEFENSNPHYDQFDALKSSVYTLKVN